MADPRDQKPVIHTRKHIARLERERRQTRFILFGFIAILVIVLGLLVYGYVDLTYLQPQRPVAEVGDVDISIEHWQARVRMERSRLIEQIQLYAQYQEMFGMDLSSQQQQFFDQLNNPVSIGQTVIDQMIEEELIRQEAAARGILVSQQEVEESIQAAYEFYPNGTPTAMITPSPLASPTLSSKTLALVTITPTPTTIPTDLPSLTPTPDLLASPSATATTGPTSTPAPTNTPLTEAGYKEAYAASIENVAQAGLTEEQLRQLYEVQILRPRLLDELAAAVSRTEEQVWARHILLPDSAIAEVVRQRIANGEDFATVAAEVSTDASNKDAGGDLGWFGKGAMVPEFETAAFSLAIGEISEPVQSQFGFHIIQVLARGDVPLSAEAYDQARQAAYSTWLAEARTRYKVVVHDNWRSIVPEDPAVSTGP